MEADLAKGMAAGDMVAYRQAYDRYAPALYGTALRLLGSVPDAEDAVQDVFVAMVQSRDRLARVSNLKAYLFAAMRHASARIRRRRNRVAPALGEPTLASESPSEAREQADRLWAAVARLPVEQQEVVALKIKGDLTFREIGLVCRTSTNTAASRYRYALGRLKQMLETHA